MNIYLDESGNLTKGNGDYFIVASFTIGDPKRISKAFRKWQQSKFPKKLKYQTEIKFNDSHVDDSLRIKTIRYFCNQDIRVFYTFLKVSNIPGEFRKNGRVHDTGLLYMEIVGATLELYLPVTEGSFIVMRDQRSLKGVNLSLFDETLRRRLLPSLPSKALLRFHPVDSTTSELIQVADWICGALARFYEHKPKGKEFYEIIKKNIVEEKELFSETWSRV